MKKITVLFLLTFVLNHLHGQHQIIHTSSTTPTDEPALLLIHGNPSFNGIDLRLNDHGIISTGGDFRFYLDDNDNSANDEFAIWTGARQLFSVDENRVLRIPGIYGGRYPDNESFSTA